MNSVSIRIAHFFSELTGGKPGKRLGRDIQLCPAKWESSAKSVLMSRQNVRRGLLRQVNPALARSRRPRAVPTLRILETGKSASFDPILLKH